MYTYLIIYESIFEKDEAVTSCVKSFGTWANPLKEVWLIKTYLGRQAIYDKIKASSPFLNKLLVIRVTNDWITFNLSQEILQWMKEGL